MRNKQTDVAGLDELDRSIIVALEHDGRRAFREIGRELGVPGSTVRWRVQRLIDENYIRIAAVGNLLNLGVDVVGVTLLKVQPGMSRKVANTLSTYPNVRFVGTSFGNADVIIQTLHSDIRALHRFVSEELPAAAPEIVSTETFQLAEVVKSSWEWGEWFDDESEKRAAEKAE